MIRERAQECTSNPNLSPRKGLQELIPELRPNMSKRSLARRWPISGKAKSSAEKKQNVFKYLQPVLYSGVWYEGVVPAEEWMLVMREFHAVIRNLGFILQAMGNSWNILNRIVT